MILLFSERMPKSLRLPLVYGGVTNEQTMEY